jgi:hypothetical protein
MLAVARQAAGDQEAMPPTFAHDSLAVPPWMLA